MIGCTDTICGIGVCWTCEGGDSATDSVVLIKESANPWSYGFYIVYSLLTYGWLTIHCALRIYHDFKRYKDDPSSKKYLFKASFVAHLVCFVSGLSLVVSLVDPFGQDGILPLFLVMVIGRLPNTLPDAAIAVAIYAWVKLLTNRTKLISFVKTALMLKAVAFVVCFSVGLTAADSARAISLVVAINIVVTVMTVLGLAVSLRLRLREASNMEKVGKEKIVFYM